MIEAFSNHLSSHLGRHLFYWAVSNSISEPNGLNLRLTELINKFHGPLERGVQVLDHLLTLEEEDFNGHWGSAYIHNYEPEIANNDDDDIGNQEVLGPAQPANNAEQQFQQQEQLARQRAVHDAELEHRINNMNRRRNSNQIETLNNGNGLLHSPPHNNSGHHNSQQHAQNLPAAQNQRSSGGSTSAAEHNLQITQPISAPSSPLASPGAMSTSASFYLPTHSSTGGGIGVNTVTTTSSGSGAYVCTAAQQAYNGGGSSSSGAIDGSNYNNATDTADPNWQATKATVLERNAAMFNNELMSDVKFVVGGDFDQTQTIPAHKYILATGSSVFYAMFYGGLAENKQEIKVPDVEPAAFLTLLRYLYCDEIQLEPDNILATLYAAKKYIVPHLARACVNYLEVKLTAKNACLLLSQSRLFEEPELMQRCWEVIDAQAEMAIKSEDFVDIDLKTFESILSRETLNCKEIHLFEAALNWALYACQKKGIDQTPQNKRQTLGQALHLIRIPTMTLEEFANGVAQTGILSSQETIDMFLHFTAKIKPTLSFPTRPRNGLKTQVCHRFQSCAYRSNQWRYRGRCDSIQFSVDRRIFIVGFGLYGSSTGAANYNVKIELKRLGRTLAENDTKFFSDGSSSTFHVFFENPIQIEPECYYTASVILDGNELSFFGQEGMSEVYMGNVTFQFQCSSESTNGTGVQGGQIPELIFYGPTAMSALSTSTTSLCASPIGAAISPSGSSSCSAQNHNSNNNNHNNNNHGSSGNNNNNGTVFGRNLAETYDELATSALSGESGGDASASGGGPTSSNGGSA